MSVRFKRLLVRAVMLFVTVLAALYAALWLTPLPEPLRSPPPQSTVFLDRHGEPLRALLVDNRRFSRPTTLAEISPSLVDATLSAEDKRFFAHPGVDPLALAAAGWSFVRGEPQRGASTITQQLVKIATSTPADDRTLGRKLREMWLALALERHWPKERILTEYLNRLDYGNLQAGIACASHYYFAKPPGDLSAAEAAMLAGLPKAPARLNPQRHADEAKARQHWVLQRMSANKQLTLDAQQRALAEPLHWRPRARDFEAPHFVELLLQRRGATPAAGGEIHTTLDLELNRFAARVLTENLQSLADKHATGGAVVVIDNESGDVLALTGPQGAFEAGAGEVNMAWCIRSPGSAMKPFTYLLALERGANPCTIVPDVSTGFATDSGIYRPNNYNHRFYGPVSLRFSLGNSLNVGAIRALELAGGPAALQQAMQRTGVTTLHHPAEYYGLGLTLGNGEVRLLELANAYAALARLGVYRPFRVLARSEGEPAEPGRRVYESSAAWLLADMLSDNTARAASFGLGSFLTFDFPVACKTGTSSDYRDNWAMGFTPEFTIGVWVGNPDGSPMRAITGVTGAAPVMHELFEHLHQTRGTSWYAAPANVASYEIDPLTGRLAPPGRNGAVMAKCLTAPEPARAEDYDAAGRNVLPPVYAEWLAGTQNNLGNLVTSAGSASDLRILAPAPGSSYFLDGDLPLDTQWIPLRAAGPGKIEWSSPTLALRGAEAQMKEGRHLLLARDTTTGHQAETWIEVKRW